MEFNDVLKKQLLVYETQIKRLTDELVALRGPVGVVYLLTCFLLFVLIFIIFLKYNR